MHSSLSLVCETIHQQFQNVDDLIANFKKVFLKAPLRVQVYKEKLPDLPLPPAPVLTRWGTWIESAIFYADHIEEIKSVVQEFDAKAAACIEKSQCRLTQKNIKKDVLLLRLILAQLLRESQN